MGKAIPFADQEQFEQGQRGTYHPLVRTHPETGEESLYICDTYTAGFEGMTTLRGQADHRLPRRPLHPARLHLPAALGSGHGGDVGQPHRDAPRAQRLRRLPARDVPHDHRGDEAGLAVRRRVRFGHAGRGQHAVRRPAALLLQVVDHAAGPLLAELLVDSPRRRPHRCSRRPAAARCPSSGLAAAAAHSSAWSCGDSPPCRCRSTRWSCPDVVLSISPTRPRSASVPPVLAIAVVLAEALRRCRCGSWSRSRGCWS